MLIFLLDTSGPTAGVCLVEDQILRYEAVVQNKLTHSESIMPMVEEAYIRAGMDISQTDYFAAVTGPGSFTGVRIGVAALKGMAHAYGKPCTEVDALEAYAWGVRLFDGVICPIRDARAGQVYGAMFEGISMERVMGDEPIQIEDFVRKALAHAGGRKLLFVGDGAEPNRKAIEKMLGEQAFFAQADLNFLRPAAAGMLAVRDLSRAVSYLDFKPLYLRPPRADKQKNLLEKYVHV